MILPLLIFNARPAAGKSEIIAFLREIALEERMTRFHIGSMKVLDDFPMLWAWFEEDGLLREHFQHHGLHTDAQGYFLYGDMLWNLLIRRLSLEVDKWLRDARENHTVIIEFSRGVEHGGYRSAYAHLSEAILRQAACLYVHVSYEESLRKNRQRYNPERADSILEHGLPDEKMAHLYAEDDWYDFTATDTSYVGVGGFRLPYMIFENEDDVTTAGGEALGERLETTMRRLWTLWKQRPQA
ncbi:MAG TPA: hypothetical protein G4O08_11550 [Anaerolineae bacterium]|nr:hypothetical protein [Anaerolineae bacterium]